MTIDNAVANPISPPAETRPTVQKLARFTLAAFLLTFVLGRVLVLLIMTRHMPDLFLHVGQTHVHHLNYGIFMLVAVGGWGVFAGPRQPVWLKRMALLYGVGLALTFDEFGMWLHLGGSYWQRASYDAVVWVGAALGLLSVLPGIRQWNRWNWITTVVIGAVTIFALKLMSEQLNLWQPFLQEIEKLAPQ